MSEGEEQPLTEILAEVDTTTLPPVSTSMADVSVRLTALEEAVEGLKKRVEILSQPPGETTTRGLDYKDFFPAASSVPANTTKGGRRRKTARKQRRRASSKKSRHIDR